MPTCTSVSHNKGRPRSSSSSPSHHRSHSPPTLPSLLIVLAFMTSSVSPALASSLLASEDVDFDLGVVVVEPGDSLGALICVTGALLSCLSLAFERNQWDLASYNRFSIATKVPVQVLCVSGPLVLVSACLYSLLALLLLMNGTREVFFIAASWSAICIDMSLVMYDSLSQILANWIDIVIHLVNFAVLVHTFRQLRFFPVVFMVSGLTFWGVVIGIRLWRRYQESKTANNGGPLRRHGSLSAVL